MMDILKTRWQQQGGYREVLVIAVPMILSTGAWSILLFVDRMFLAWYSPQAIAAAMPAGIASFSMMCLFIGTTSYINTFVAQYYGAGHNHRIGAIVWQGIYLSIFSLILVIPAYFLAETLFTRLGHTAELQALEILYFKLLMYSASFVVFNSVVSSFFSGLGRTLVVMWVSVLITMINLMLDYLLIFGYFGFPRMGVRGAAIATNIAIISGSVVFFVLLFQKSNRLRFQTLEAWKLDRMLLRRLVYFGFPNGLRLFIDMSSFTAFLLIVGMLGTIELAASNIAFNVNVLSFLPMVGLMIGVSVLVGQYLGANQPQLAERATWSAVHIAMVFFGCLAVLYLSIPELFIWPFTLNEGFEDRENSIPLIIILLRFVAFFGLFDALFLVFLGALEGAGDTQFIMRTSILISWFLLVLPCWIYIRYFEPRLMVLWWMITLNIMLYCMIYFYRFCKGPWRELRVIN